MSLPTTTQPESTSTCCRPCSWARSPTTACAPTLPTSAPCGRSCCGAAFSRRTCASTRGRPAGSRPCSWGASGSPWRAAPPPRASAGPRSSASSGSSSRASATTWATAASRTSSGSTTSSARPWRRSWASPRAGGSATTTRTTLSATPWSTTRTSSTCPCSPSARASSRSPTGPRTMRSGWPWTRLPASWSATSACSSTPS
mmetsp:Transcript_29194/g.90970  ORF Transcript_29194/g.90970 Transcript_29194/m.90970 type:complete len:201 (+) Transcript_29194:166-768(+)